MRKHELLEFIRTAEGAWPPRALRMKDGGAMNAQTARANYRNLREAMKLPRYADDYLLPVEVFVNVDDDCLFSDDPSTGHSTLIPHVRDGSALYQVYRECLDGLTTNEAYDKWLRLPDSKQKVWQTLATLITDSEPWQTRPNRRHAASVAATRPPSNA